MHDFFDYIIKPPTLVAVVLPLLITLFALAREVVHPDTKFFNYLMLVPGFFISCAFSGWAYEDKTLGLHICPFMFILVCFTYDKKAWQINSLTFAALVFINTLFVDIACSWQPALSLGWANILFPQTALSAIQVERIYESNHLLWYAGIGGGGLLDSLLVFSVGAYVWHKIIVLKYASVVKI